MRDRDESKFLEFCTGEKKERTKTMLKANPMSTVELYDAIRCGDEGAFSCYYEKAMPWLVTLIVRITKDFEEARNIAHDTFAKLWLHRQQIDPAQSLDGFISKVATNAALNFLKKRQSRNKYSNEQLFLQTGEENAPDATVIARETEKLIVEAIGNMPAQQQKVYLLSRNENMTYNEIAERMNLSYNTVLYHMKAALKTIRAVISTPASRPEG